jgi:ribose-phosphate pyrophosphokinase
MNSSDNYSRLFITPEDSETIGRRDLIGPNGWLLFVACNGGIDFARAVKEEYESLLSERGSGIREVPMVGTRERPITTMFDDTETCPRLPKYVTGSSAYVFQCCHENTTGFTVNENIQQLIQVVRTLRAHRAKTITVVTPYSPYSRQDKPTFMKREATLAKLFADQLKIAGAGLHLCYHPHAYSLQGFYEPEMTFVALSGLTLFVEMFDGMIGRPDTVAVSTDAGGAKFTVHYAGAMDLNYAIANKYRTAHGTANLLGVIGDLSGVKTAIITDDETVTGKSLMNAVRQLHDNHGVRDIYVALSHLKLRKEYVPELVACHKEAGLRELRVTDTIPQVPDVLDLDFVIVHSIARRFAGVINRLHYNQSIGVLHQQHEQY